MTRPARTMLCCLGLSLAFATPGRADGPLDDLLPPPVRQMEKRGLGPNQANVRQSYYNGQNITGAVFSPDSKSLLTSGGPQGLSIWDVANGRAVGQLSGAPQHQTYSAAFTPDGKQLVLGTADMNGDAPVTIWDIAKREKIRDLDDDTNDTPIRAFAVAPDGKTVALAASWTQRQQTPTIAIWDLVSGDEVGQVEGLLPALMPGRQLMDGFHALAYSPDGRTLAVQLTERVVLVEVATRQKRAEFALPHFAIPNPDQQPPVPGALAFSPDGRLLAVGCEDGAIRRFDLRSGHELTPLPAHVTPILALVCTPDGKHLRSYGLDGQLSVWRMDASLTWRPKKGELSKEALDALWDNLRSDDPVDLFGSLEVFAAHPAQTVPFLREHVPPATQADVEQIEKLIQDLQKPDYNSRKHAVIALRKVGPAAIPALLKVQETGNFDQTMQRLLNQLMTRPQPPETLRVVRAIAVLERIGTAAARKHLEVLASGAAETTLTLQAKAAIERLGKAEPDKATPAPEALWEALASDDSSVAFHAIRGLAQAQAAGSVRTGLKNLVGKGTFNDEPARVEKLIADLDNDNFTVRGEATQGLRNLGTLMIPSLKKALEGQPSIETKRRLEELVASASSECPQEIRRVGRAFETLELMGGPEAHATLTALAQDNGPRWLRDAATAALRRQGR